MIGDLRHFMKLQQESRSDDDGGGSALSWADVTTFWASIEPTSIREDRQGEKLTGRSTHRIYARYDSRFAANKRIVWGSRIFNIRGVKNIHESGRFVEIQAEEGVAV